MNRHTIALDDPDLAIEELRAFTATGGRSVVDPTCRGIGRDPTTLRRIAAEAGLNIVAPRRGAGAGAHRAAAG